jgi:hypothetical protein
MVVKQKYSFVLDGVSYSDISGYTSQYSNDSINIGVAGTAQMIRQYIKQKYPNIPAKDYVWVNSRSFANGDSIDVYLNNAPSNFYSELKKDLNAKFEEGKFDGMTDSYTYIKGTETTEDGRKVDYGTKYLNVNNRKPYDSKAKDLSEKDWESALKKQTQNPKPIPNASKSTTTSNYSLGDTLMDCFGWTISKKTLPDGRVVYNAKIKPSTPKNRGDWNTIKGEIYTETGFKWGRFGAFEKWGTMIPYESKKIEKLCEILGKYYDGGNQSSSSQAPEPPPQQQEPTVDPSLPEVGDKFKVKTEVGGKIYEIVGMAMGSIDVKPIDEDWVTEFGYTEVKNNFKEGRWIKVSDNGLPEPPPQQRVEVILNGMFFEEYTTEFAAHKAMLEESRGSKQAPIELEKKFDGTKITLYYFSKPFVYGKNWDIPVDFGNSLQLELVHRGFVVHVTPNNNLIISKPNSAKYTLTDNGGEFNIDKNNKFLTSLGYSNRDTNGNSYPVPPQTLAKVLLDIVEDEIDKDAGGNEPKPAANQPNDIPNTGKSKQDIEKAIKGLQYLADNGNEKAIKAIKGLKYLLNK